MEETTVIPQSALDGTFQHFLEYLREGGAPAPVLSPKRFSQAMHIDLQTLAEQAHVHRNTISRAPGSRGVQDFLREALRVIKAATDLNGDLNKALFWYRNEPLSVFGYKTAERLVSEGRTDDLLRYIASIEVGAAG
ncbi:MAG: hypothetical protein WCF44_21550 [Candidatus Methylophosphatis roskildensis]